MTEEEGRRLSYKFRLYPNEEQKRQMAVTFGCCRYVYNHFLQARIDAYGRTRETIRRPVLDASGEPVVGEDGKRAYEEVPNPAYDPAAKPMTFYDTSKALTALKRETVDEEGRRWLYDADASALVYSLRHLDAAYKNFFRRVKQGETPGFPRFKSRSARAAYTTQKCVVGEGFVILPKLGTVKARTHREVEGEVVSANVSRTASGEYYVAVNVKGAPAVEAPPAEGAAGYTMGVERWIVSSDGEVLELPGSIRKLEGRLAREQRRLSRKVGARKGEPKSANYEKQRVKAARLQERIARIRANATHEATRSIVDSHAVIVSRDMGSSDLLQSKSARDWKIARRIASGNFAEVNRQLAYKSAWAGREFVLVPQETPTAQTCSKCGHREPLVGERLAREWTCPECGAVHDRKYNGAKNVLEEGLRMLGGSEG